MTEGGNEVETMTLNPNKGLHTPGPWQWSFFAKADGSPIQTVEDVAATIAGSAHYSERTELWGVTLNDADKNDDGRATVVCYTGNGPNAHNNARLIACAPPMLATLEAINACACYTQEDASQENREAMLQEIGRLARAAIAAAKPEQPAAVQRETCPQCDGDGEVGVGIELRNCPTCGGGGSIAKDGR